MKILRTIINIVLISIIAVCAYKIYDKSAEYKKADESYAQIRLEKENENNNNLYNKYEDYRGWIKVDNTNIDYPIVQGKDNSFYLDKDINKNYVSSGSIFMNYLNNGFNDENTILFGHHMRNKTMFAQLEKYKEKEFFQNDNDIKIEVENDKVLTYKVFSVYVTDDNDNYIKTNFDNKSEYKEFLDKIKNKSIYKSDINVDENDKIITLSTCSYEFDDARMVVHGKLLK